MVIEMRLQRDGSLLVLCPLCGGRERFMLVDTARTWTREHGCTPDRQEEAFVTA